MVGSRRVKGAVSARTEGARRASGVGADGAAVDGIHRADVVAARGLVHIAPEVLRAHAGGTCRGMQLPRFHLDSRVLTSAGARNRQRIELDDMGQNPHDPIM